MAARKSIVIAGKRIKLAHMRRSAKGAEVVGARVHIKGLGTVYVQVYERDETMEPLRPPISPPAPAAPTPPRHTPRRHADQIDQMMLETIKALSDRLNSFERRAVMLPEPSAPKIPNPRPSDGRG